MSCCHQHVQSVSYGRACAADRCESVATRTNVVHARAIDSQPVLRGYGTLFVEIREYSTMKIRSLMKSAITAVAFVAHLTDTHTTRRGVQPPQESSASPARPVREESAVAVKLVKAPIQPQLPDAVASEVAGQEKRVSELERLGLIAETREAQDAALSDAIALVDQVIATRISHQGNIHPNGTDPELLRWRSLQGAPCEWHEIVFARRIREHLLRLQQLNPEQRAALASVFDSAVDAERLYGSGLYADAQKEASRQLKTCQRILGEDDLDTLRASGDFGVLLQAQGNFSDAEKSLREVMEKSRIVFGDEHPITAAAECNLAVLLSDRGQFADAEKHVRAALKVRRHVLGPDHPATRVAELHMGFQLRSAGKLNEAEPYCRVALHALRRQLGAEDRTTLKAIRYMGTLLRDQGKLDNAEPYIDEALVIARRLLPDRHPEFLGCADDMGYLLLAKGEFARAEPYIRETYETRREVLGDEHPETLVSMGYMAALLQAQGNLPEAERYVRDALEKKRRVLGDTHPGTIISIVDLATLLMVQGKYAEAELFYREALSTAEQTRVDVIGDALARAQLAGTIGLPAIATRYAHMLQTLGRDAEAMGVLERGRARAALDLFAGGRGNAEIALPSERDPLHIAKYHAAIEAEEEARLFLVEAEARLSNSPGEEKAARLERVRDARSALLEKTAAVFVELRGLVPTAEPMTTDEVLRSLKDNEAVVTWSWAKNSVIALVACKGAVYGMPLARSREEVLVLNEKLRALRAVIASRPTGNPWDSVLSSAREAVAPAELRAFLQGATTLIAVVDGPLTNVPVELFLDTPVSYAVSATIGLRTRTRGRAPALTGANRGPITGVIVAPTFPETLRTPEPDWPKTGILLAAVVEGGNASRAGMRRGDILVTYNGASLHETADLPAAINAFLTAAAEDQRSVSAVVWRPTNDGIGRTIEVGLARGKLGVEVAPLPPRETLWSMALLEQPEEELGVNVAMLEQVRYYGATLGPLKGAKLEATNVAAMLRGNATLLLGENATVPKVRTAVADRKPTVVHVATHGLIGNEQRPLSASLAFTAPNRPSADDIGFLTLEDMLGSWGGKLQGVELVTLSACDTGQGIKQGDTVIALPLGLLACGAETVVASLWEIDDTATALFMTRFYTNWVGNMTSARAIDGENYPPNRPMPKLAALREAQRWLRFLSAAEAVTLAGASIEEIAASPSREPRPRLAPIAPAAILAPADMPYQHPYFWQAFVLYGSPE